MEKIISKTIVAGVAVLALTACNQQKFHITGNITRRRSTNWLETKIREYLASGGTPEMTIIGVMNDDNSDYYVAHGTNTITLVGVVLTGDLPLTRLDSNGEVVEDNIAFHAKAMT